MLAKSRLIHNKGKVLRRYFSHSTYERSEAQTVSRWQTLFVLTFSISLCLGAAFFGRGEEANDLISPIPVSAHTVEVQVKEVVIDKNENIDTWIGEAVDEFLPSHTSEARMIMHCLAHREAGHGRSGKATDAHGDNGLAGGPFQFHEATWERMRSQMIKQGVATETGSRYDFKEAARTTAWAIANGRAKEWGPILRDSKNNNYAACQLPSWYPQK